MADWLTWWILAWPKWALKLNQIFELSFVKVKKDGPAWPCFWLVLVDLVLLESFSVSLFSHPLNSFVVPVGLGQSCHGLRLKNSHDPFFGDQYKKCCQPWQSRKEREEASFSRAMTQSKRVVRSQWLRGADFALVERLELEENRKDVSAPKDQSDNKSLQYLVELSDWLSHPHPLS